MKNIHAQSYMRTLSGIIPWVFARAYKGREVFATISVMSGYAHRVV